MFSEYRVVAVVTVRLLVSPKKRVVLKLYLPAGRLIRLMGKVSAWVFCGS